MSDLEQKKNMTDEERLALATKLDLELDAFIDGLEKRKYTDGWSEDTWEQEMAKHPFFMKKSPDVMNTELDPLTEGLQKLKYDPKENTPDDLANTYKEDGNFYVKHKKFRMSIISYTEGIQLKSENKEINAVLYNNRSAAQFFLKNYRSSMLDAQRAYELKPDYMKARIRAAQCANQLNRFDECLEMCDSILQDHLDEPSVINLRKVCIERKNKKQRDERKRALEIKKKSTILTETLNTLRLRKFKFETVSDLNYLTENEIQPKLAPLVDFPVYQHDNGNLQWPTVFCYPEFLTTDFQQQLDEMLSLSEVLQEMFQEHVEHDHDRKYHIDNLNVYYENRITGKVHLIDQKKTIKDIVDEKFFYIIDGCLMFFILAKNSTAEKEFLNQPRHPLGK